MSEDPPEKPAAPAASGRRFWLTVGEIVAVLGLGLAGLNYWENHRDREETLAQATKQAQAQKVSVFVMRASADAGGKRVMLDPTSAAQVVQSQRYLFPAQVADHAREIGAGRTQIDLVWFEGGLRAALKAAHKDGAPYPKGEATLPVGVMTTYVENGETHTDQSLYRVGYVADPGMLGALKLHLTGAALMRRGVAGDLQAAVNGAWKPPAAQAPSTKAAK